MEEPAVEPHNAPRIGVAPSPGIPRDRVEDWLGVGRRVADDPEDFGRRRLLLKRLRLALQRLLQSLLKLADPRAFVLRRLTGDGQLGFDLALPRLCPPTHRPLLPSQSVTTVTIEGRLRDGVLVGKSGSRVFDAACERTRALGGLIHTSIGRASGCERPMGIVPYAPRRPWRAPCACIPWPRGCPTDEKRSRVECVNFVPTP